MTKLLTEEEQKVKVEEITQAAFVALSEWQAGSPVDWQSAKLKCRADLYDLIQSQKQAHAERATGALKDIILHAAPDGTQDDGDFVGFYVLPTGPMHRAIAYFQDKGGVDTMGDVSMISRYQTHLKDTKQAHGEMVIGEDDKEGFIAMDGRNRLRAEQRERNRLGADSEK